MKGHEGRVGAIAWSSNVLSSGSKDKTILNRDLRAKDDFYASL
jgi:cell division cycle 20-like protein 1 (cofactor of APC complex)